MTTLKRLIRCHKDTVALGLPSNTTRRALIQMTGEKPGKNWLKRVTAKATTPSEAPMTKTNTHDWIMKIRPEYADCMINMGGSDYATVLGPNKEANARLIASAPALLEALEATMLYLPEGEIRRNARAALKLAKGE